MLHGSLSSIPHVARGLADLQPAAASRSSSAVLGSPADMLPGTYRRSEASIESAAQSFANKAGGYHASAPPPPSFTLSTLYTHASAIAGSAASPPNPYFELTAASSRDSLPVLDPAAEVRRGETTPQKHAKNSRRTKPHKPNRWSRSGAGSSDDTGSDRKAPASHAPRYSSPTAAASPQHARPAPKQSPRAHIATHHAAAHQGRLMAAAFGGASGDSRRGVASPRPKGRGMAGMWTGRVVADTTSRSQKHFLPQCHHLRALSV